MKLHGSYEDTCSLRIVKLTQVKASFYSIKIEIPLE